MVDRIAAESVAPEVEVGAVEVEVVVEEVDLVGPTEGDDDEPAVGFAGLGVGDAALLGVVDVGVFGALVEADEFWTWDAVGAELGVVMTPTTVGVAVGAGRTSA